MCVKYKKKKEEEDEVAELDCRNIITSGQYSPQVYAFDVVRGTQRQFSENICSEDDLRSRIFVTFAVKFLACLPLLGFSNI